MVPNEDNVPPLIRDSDNVPVNGKTDSTIMTHIDAEMAHNDEPMFSHDFTPAPPIASSRYNRQLLIPSISISGHQRIASSKILIIGLGGLGSPAALYLASAGVGTLGLMDDDQVELSNLHRQIVHCEASVSKGLSKAESALRACRSRNSEIEIVAHEMRCDVSVGAGKGRELFDIVDRYDVVLDCTDNPATRYLISDICVLLGKVLVSGAAQRLDGQLCLLNYELYSAGEAENMNGNGGIEMRKIRGPCYRCVFPTPPSPEMVKGCGEIGILGPVVGTIGTLMASEALRYIVKGPEKTRKPTLLIYNAWSINPSYMFRNIVLRGRREDCLACGDDVVLKEKGKNRITLEEVMEGRWSYVSFCGVSEELKVLNKEQRVEARDFLKPAPKNTSRSDSGTNGRDWSKAVVIDIREPHETEMGPKIGKSINIPFSMISAYEETIADISALLEGKDENGIVFVCQQGNDSQIAAKKLLDFREASGKKNGPTDVDLDQSRTVFIGDVVGGYAAMEKLLVPE